MAEYVVSRPFWDSNIGSNLSSLAGAAWLAKHLARTLVVDWRGLSQLRDASVNYFPEFFERSEDFLGVEVIYAPDPEVGDYRPHENADWLSPDDAYAILNGDMRAPTASHLVLQAYHGLDRIHRGPDAERLRLLRSFYRQIRPEHRIAALIDRWWEETYDGAFVVGVNVRTGNGQYFNKGQRYVGRVDVGVFKNEMRLLRVLERAVHARVRAVPRAYRSGFRVFYATDSKQMSELLAQLPNATTRRAVFPPPGTGDTYVFADADQSDRRAVTDTVVDMFLLARCDALVYNSSLFNQYARVLTGQFSGNQVHIESLFLRRRVRRAATSLHSRLRPG